jgi:RimJ/RimL family protein N-acetyltransferase
MIVATGRNEGRRFRGDFIRFVPVTCQRGLHRTMTGEVRLRDVEPDDLPIFFEQQLDADATRMAGFPSRDRAAFDAHWANNILGNPAGVTKTIVLDDEVAGYIGSWTQDGVRLIAYWIGKESWGRGVATQALAAFLRLVTARPLRAHVVPHNLASIRVLEKCGFRMEREEGAELVLVLDGR